MRPADSWRDYELLDATNHNRLERWGSTLLIRPDPQVIWKNAEASPLWAKADAIYYRSAKGGGQWEYHKKLPQKWQIHWQDLTLIVSPTGFKHTGVFPEQAVNWAWYQEKIKAAGRPIKVLNLFGYTGGATLACLAAGASVTHVDASKGMVAWARENAAASRLADRPCRWIVDDCAKFVQREIRRGNKYDGVIMDPPSYGRGPGGEIWKLEDNVYDLITLTEQVLSDDPLFFAINSYTEGLSPAVMEYIVKTTLCPVQGGRTHCDEIGLPVSATGGVVPCGATAIWEKCPMPTETPMLRVQDVKFRYDPEQPRFAVDGVTMDLHRGEFVAVLGANGCGKSTLAKHLNAILLPETGTVLVEGMDTRNEEHLYDIRQKVGIVFQNPDNQIVATIVEEDVAFAPENLGVPPQEIRTRIDEAMKLAGIYEKRDAAPYKLSGGQKQRVAIAGVIAMRPDCLVLDEATAMLDPHGRSQVMRTIRQLREAGITIVSITHYMEEAAQADRVLVMSRGRIVMEGTPEQVFSQTERLHSYHLDVPQAAELRDELVKAGIAMPENVITPDRCAEELFQLLKD